MKDNQIILLSVRLLVINAMKTNNIREIENYLGGVAVFYKNCVPAVNLIFIMHVSSTPGFSPSETAITHLLLLVLLI